MMSGWVPVTMAVMFLGVWLMTVLIVFNDRRHRRSEVNWGSRP